jgi:hypothetical protein
MLGCVADFYDHKIIPELVYPGRFGNVPIQFVLGVGIKDKNASIRQVPIYVGEELLLPLFAPDLS